MATRRRRVRKRIPFGRPYTFLKNDRSHRSRHDDPHDLAYVRRFIEPFDAQGAIIEDRPPMIDPPARGVPPGKASSGDPFTANLHGRKRRVQQKAARQ
jgi:hypothetical protein